MNLKVYIALVPLLIAGCGGKDESGKSGPMASGPVNSALVSVSQVVGVGKVEPEQEITSLAAATGGVVKEIYRSDGDSVRKDEPLVRLDDELELIRASQLRNQYNAQKSQLDIDRLNLQEAEARLANKSKLLESTMTLAMKGAETRQALEDLQTEVTTLNLAVERSKAALQLAENRLRELSEQARYAEAEASKKILRSPHDGILLELHVKTGSALSQFGSYADFAPSGPLTVRTEVDELFAGRLSTGLDADIRFIGSDSVVARGKVTFLSPYLKKKSLFSQKASDQEDRLVREVRIRLDGANGLILNSKVESVIKLKNDGL